jgi:membrane fusion protein (multidrug efflux system)
MSSIPGRVLGILWGVNLLLISCRDESAKPTVTPEVSVVPVGKENVNLYSEYVGQTYGASDVNIQPRIEGWITGIYFKEGQHVKQGDLLYTIDDLPAKTKIDAAAADVARAKSTLINKKSDLDRVKPLAEMNALSQRDLDAATAAYQAALNDVQIAESRLTNSNIELSYTRVRAPISGVIGISKVLVGDYVAANGINNVINTISSLGEIRVRFPISENDYLRFAEKIRKDPKVKVKLFSDIPVQLKLSDGSIYPETGKFDLANRQIDPATGSIIIQAIFANSQNILRPGQYVRVRFETDEFKDAALLPQQAVNQLQNIYQVFLLGDSDKLKPKVVKVGNRVGSNWIISEGVTPGEKVAVIGSVSINPKLPVKPVLMQWNYDSTSKN